MDALKVFFEKLRTDEDFRNGFRAHMGATMAGMDKDIMTMQKSMNAKISEGFLSYAKAAKIDIPESELDELLKEVNANLHQKMGRLFQEEFASAISKLMK